MQANYHPPENDTIVAVSTPRGNAPVAITRLSGPRAVETGKKVFPELADADGNYKAVSGWIITRRGVKLPAAAYVMRAPSSYTREDVVELHTAGAPPVLELILESLYAAGARPAEPGEFTRRAFLNGRIDLAQAEAVMSVINADDEAELRAAQSSLRGEKSRELASLRDRMLGLLARVEVDLDFDEDEIGELDPAELASELEKIESVLQRAVSEPPPSPDRGVLRVSFFGLPNAGKSSLLNMLVGRECAVIQPEAGTTRDPVTAEMVYKGISMVFIDPAGVTRKPGEGSVAAQARAAAFREREESDIVIFVHDAALDVSEEEAEFFDFSRPTVLALNKTDLPDRGSVPESWAGTPAVETSCVLGTGREKLLDSIVDLLRSGSVNLTFSHGPITVRHGRHIEAALSAIRRIREGDAKILAADERAALELREGLYEIGCIIGETTTDDLLDTIFSSFCIGK